MLPSFLFIRFYGLTHGPKTLTILIHFKTKQILCLIHSTFHPTQTFIYEYVPSVCNLSSPICNLHTFANDLQIFAIK